MTTNKVFGVAADVLKQFITKIEHLEAEKSEIQNLIKEAFAEAKASGFDTKVMKQVIKERKMDVKDLDEQELLLMTYKRALGMLPELDEAA